MLLLNLFAVQLKWVPVIGDASDPVQVILPAITLAVIDAALIARLMRGTMLEVLRADYVKTAIAKGVPRRQVLLKHVLRNSVIPVVTYIGISFGGLLGGAIITETIFNWDGVGMAISDPAAEQSDRGRGGHLGCGRLRGAQPGGRPDVRDARPPESG